MKTKNCKVRVKDIKQGKRIFIAHPVYGIDEKIVTGRPFISPHTRSLFASCITIYDDWKHEDVFSLRDAGITKGESYNYRRTFFKRHQAEEWVSKMKTDKGFIKQQAVHESRCEDFGLMFDLDYCYD